MKLEEEAEETHAEPRELLRVCEFIKSTAIAPEYIYISAR